MPAAPTPQPHLAALTMFNASLSAQIGSMLQMQVPGDQVMNLLIEHVGKVLCLVEPAGVRNEILGEICRNLPGVMRRHLEDRMRSPGGVLLPNAGGKPN